ncbi:MAG: hypothetical protein WC879_03510 [Melioribacteraceae bacterium]
MSKSFSFDEEVAKQYGVEEAVMIRSFQFWIDLNKANGRNLREGRTWTYNTYESLAEQFPFWVKKDKETGLEEPDAGKVRRLIDSLISEGVLIKTCQFNRWKIDKTNWYAFEDESFWLKAKSVENCPLLKNADEETFFDNLIDKSNAEGENEENLRLSKNADVKVNNTDLSEFPTDENNNPTAEKSRREVERDRSGLSNSADVSLSKNADQYQILNSSLPDAEEEKKDPAVFTHELLLDKKPLDAYLEGSADKLKFCFSDLDLVNKNIERIFRMFVKDSQPHPTHVDRVRNQLLNDMRPELSQKVCWIIIQIAFMEYPGTNKKYQDFESLMKRIAWKKNDFVQDLHTHNQKLETAAVRVKEREQQKNDNQEAIDQILTEAKDQLERYQHKLNARQVEEITALIKNRNYLQAQSKLIEYIEDNEAAA